MCLRVFVFVILSRYSFFVMPITDFRIEVGAVTGLPDGALVSFNGPIDARSAVRKSSFS